jgi:hypothetical protein
VSFIPRLSFYFENIVDDEGKRTEIQIRNYSAYNDFKTCVIFIFVKYNTANNFRDKIVIVGS